MIPRLYPAGTTVFSNEGLGALSDCISAVTTTAINGVPELVINYPINGVHANEIDERCVIIADRDQHQGLQPYIVRSVDKSTLGRIEIRAVHLAMDLLDGVALKPYEATSLSDALTKIATYKTDNLAVTFSSDFTSNKPFKHAVPSSVKQAMGGMDGSIIDTYGGEWDLVDLTATLRSRMGADNGVAIRYGKNLQRLKMETDWSSVYTGIYPFWTNIDDGSVTQMTTPVYSLGTFSFTRTLMLDVSGEFMNQPAEADLLTFAQNYAASHTLTSPKITWDVVMQDLRNAPEYKSLALLEQVALGDTVSIYYPDFGITASARIVSEEYDVLRGKYNRLTIGSVRSSLAKAIAGQAQEAKTAIAQAQTAMAEAIQRATDAITGNVGGYIVTVLNASDEPQELLVMDTNDITTARKVWRWNLSGLGYSSTGYAGPYSTAITQDGEIVADFIKTGTLDASLINVINLIAQHVRATDGVKVMDIASSQLTINNGTNWRAWLRSDQYDQGALLLYTGKRPNLNGNADDAGNDGTSFMSYIDANNVAVGVGINNKANGWIRGRAIDAENDGRFAVYDANKVGRAWLQPSGLQLTDSSGTTRFRAYDNGLVTGQDTSDTVRYRLNDSGEIVGYDAAGHDTVHAYGASGRLLLRDTSNVTRVDLNSSGNSMFYNASGNAVMRLYSASGELVLYDSSARNRVHFQNNNSRMMLRNASNTITVDIRGDGTASEAPLPVNQGGTGMNGTITGDCTITLSGASWLIKHVYQWGNVVFAQLYFTTGNTNLSADTYYSLGTLTGVSSPHDAVRIMGVTGQEFWTATTPCYGLLGTSGEVEFRTSTAQRRFILNFVYVV